MTSLVIYLSYDFEDTGDFKRDRFLAGTSE